MAAVIDVECGLLTAGRQVDSRPPSVAVHFYRAALNAGQSSQEKAVCLSIHLSNA